MRPQSASRIWTRSYASSWWRTLRRHCHRDWYAKRWATLTHGRQESNILSLKKKSQQNLDSKPCMSQWSPDTRQILLARMVTTVHGGLRRRLGFETMHVPVVVRHQADTPCQNGHNRARRASSKTHIPLNERQVTLRRENNPKLFLSRAGRKHNVCSLTFHKVRIAKCAT